MPLVIAKGSALQRLSLEKESPHRPIPSPLQQRQAHTIDRHAVPSPQSLPELRRCLHLQNLALLIERPLSNSFDNSSEHHLQLSVPKKTNSLVKKWKDRRGENCPIKKLCDFFLENYFIPFRKPVKAAPILPHKIGEPPMIRHSSH